MLLFPKKEACTNDKRKELSQKKPLLTLLLYLTCNITAEEVKAVNYTLLHAYILCIYTGKLVQTSLLGLELWKRDSQTVTGKGITPSTNAVMSSETEDK